MTPAIALAQAIPAPIEATATTSAVLRTGTEVPLKLSEELSTKHKLLKVGQRFRLETAETVTVQGVTVIPVGTPAVGEVTEVRNTGMWGKSGHFTGRVLYLTVNGRQIHLSGTFDEKGGSGGAVAGVVSAVVFLPAGFFIKGHAATLPVGAPVKAFVDEDVALAMTAATPAPLVVNVPAQAN